MNPFKVLNLRRDASAQEVVQGAALALRKKQHSAREIAEARQLLMDPKTRPIISFLYSADLSSLLGPCLPREAPLRVEDLQRLALFD
ncbi:hypothetical protein [Candidatus Electronema sp. PJ]|uniref:hypothetical protein n=1 Tax=Candidatus Electronema sp. PJ TaxID=3401572 RepID=UPI003AA8E38F